MSSANQNSSSSKRRSSSPRVILDEKDVSCPICREIFVFPRMYDCGHTICEICMKEMDIRDRTGNLHTVNIHNCPVCRAPTLKSWNNRPINITIQQIASTHKNFEKRKKEILEKRKEIEPIPKNVNLAKIVSDARLKLSLEIYDKILIKLLHDAAKEGKNHIIITDKKKQ